MSKTQTGILISILDRLVDKEPNQIEEAKPLRTQTCRQLEQSLRRDLEWLLNTRVSAKSINWDDRTVIDYGVPDFGNLFTHNPEDGQRIADILEKTIKAYEPRLEHLKVKLQENPTPKAKAPDKPKSKAKVQKTPPPKANKLRYSPHPGERQILIEGVLRICEIGEAFSFPIVLSDQGNQIKVLD